jgi:hypothetical protein
VAYESTQSTSGDKKMTAEPGKEEMLPLFLFLGQSYFGKNSNNGRVLSPPVPNPTLMLAGAHQIFGGGDKPLTEQFKGFEPAFDYRPRVQSPVTAFLYRYAKFALEQGLPQECVGHSESRSNGSVEHFLPETHPSHRNSSIFVNLMTAVSSYVKFARNMGRRPYVPALFFCQGTADRMMLGQDYLTRLNDLFDAVSAAVSKVTGQPQPLTFFIVQPPAKPFDGRWPCLQAHIAICEERSDCVFALSGWALPQHDRTHFTGKAAAMVGEICAEVYLGNIRGEDLSAPRITRVQRTGLDITAYVSSSSRLLIDAGPDTPRHRINGAPLSHYGIQLDRGEIATCRLANNTIKIKLARENPIPKILYFAHASRESLNLPKPANKANQSLNRGNIRVERSFKSLFFDEPLYQWLASSAHSIREQ